MSIKFDSACFDFQSKPHEYRVRFYADSPFVSVAKFEGGWDVFRDFEILDKCMTANKTHALRILRYALDIDDKPMQNTVRGQKPCLKIVVR